MRLWICILMAMSGMVLAQCPPTGIPFADEFSGTELDSCWNWLREDSTHWSLAERPGWLRIRTQIGDIGLDGRNELVRLRPEGDYWMETKVVIDGSQQHQQAGLLIHLDDNNWVGFIRGNVGGPRLGLHWEVNGSYSLEGIPLAAADTLIWLRLGVRDSVVTADWSRDGATWQRHGQQIYGFAADATTRIGVYADNGNVVVPEIPADFDYFRVGRLLALSVFPGGLDWGVRDLGANDELSVSLTNLSLFTLPILSLTTATNTFVVDSTGLSGDLAPLETFPLPLTFAPPMAGFYEDTLMIVWQSISPDTVRIPLRGQGAVIPQAVESLVVKKGALNGMQLFWTPVSETISGQPVVPDFYVIQAATSPDGPFVPIAGSIAPTYLHLFITQTQTKYFYRVTAVKE